MRKRRLSYGSFPKPLGGAVPYANSRSELADLLLGEKVRLVMSTAAWAEVMRPRLAEMDAKRPRKGPAPSYTSEELESCLLYQRLAGKATYSEARALLAGDRAEADRITLGFNAPRKRVGAGLRIVQSLDGVPSEVTIWRHKKRFGLEAHLNAYRELFEHMTIEHFEVFPEEMSEEARIVYWDGSVLRSHYSSFERVNKETGNAKEPTLKGGGYRPRVKDNAGKDGHGFNLIAAVTQTGLPLGARLTAINDPEAKTARGILEDEWHRIVAPYLNDETVRVMAMDAAYTGGHFRRAVHRAGFIPNCHPVSHANTLRSRAHAQRRHEAKIAIGYRTAGAVRQRKSARPWHLNGHYELVCNCGHGKMVRRAEKNTRGEAVARLEGACSTCGPISITAGEWRPGDRRRAVVKALPGEDDRIDWRVGNPLTYEDPLSQVYGSARFGHNEGFYGALVTRFGLLRGKSWYRDRRAAERDLLQVFCSMHALAMEQRRRVASTARPPAPVTGAGSGPPPPLAQAA